MQCVELSCQPTTYSVYGNSHTFVTDGCTKPTKAELVVTLARPIGTKNQ
jgi:hypothetical protein